MWWTLVYKNFKNLKKCKQYIPKYRFTANPVRSDSRSDCLTYPDTSAKKRRLNRLQFEFHREKNLKYSKFRKS